MGHFLLIDPLMKIAGKDAWISALLSIPAGMIFSAVFIALRRRWNGILLIDGIYQTMGKFGGWVFSLIFAFYFLTLAVITIRGLESFIATVFMPETPYWALGGSFLLLMVWSLYRNIESIARMAVILLLIILITGHTVGLDLMQEKQYSRLLPLLDNGWQPVLTGALLLISTWSELVAILMFRSKNYTLKEERQGYLTIILFNGILYAITTSSVAAAFGMPLAAHVDWPVQVEVRLIKFGFWDRVDIYGLFVVTAGSYIRAAMFLFTTCETVSRMLSLSSYKSAILPVSGVALVVSLLGFWNEQTFSNFLRMFYSYSWLIILLPLFLLLVTMIQQRRT